jgi:hypothetical protein
MSLHARLTLCLLVPVIAVSLLVGATAALGLVRAQSELAEARYRFVAGQLRDAVESGLTLGLPLEDLRQTGEILARAAARDPDIAVVLVFGADGTVRYATDPGLIGEPVPDAWRLPEAAPARSLDDGQPGAVVAAPLVNSYGDLAGGLALRHGRLSEAVRTERTLAVVGGTALLLAAVAGVAAAFAARACLAGPRRVLAGLAARFAAFAARPDAAAADPPGEPGERAGAGLARAGRAFEARAAGAWRDIAAREREIERLDELA